MKLAVVLFFSALALAQQSATTSAPCSPIAPENTGTITINCPGMSKEQWQKMLAILNKIRTNQLDPDVVMAKLDEIQNDIRHIQIRQGWTEPTREQLKTLKDKLGVFPKQTVSIVVTNQDNNKRVIADQLRDVFKDAGWDATLGANIFLGGDPVRGIYVQVKADTLATRTLIYGLRDIFGKYSIIYNGVSDKLGDGADVWLGIFDSPKT